MKYFRNDRCDRRPSAQRRRNPHAAFAAVPARLVLGLGFTIAMLTSHAAEPPTVSDEDALISLVAALVPKPENTASQRGLELASEAVASWIERHRSSDRDRGQMLASLVEELDRTGNPGAALALLGKAVEKLGVEFRTNAAEAQIARDTPRAMAFGAMLLQSAAADPLVKTRQQSLLAEAVESAPEDRDVLRIALYYCDSDPCSSLNPAQKLAKVQPRNAANWVFQLNDAGSPLEIETVLRKAEAASEFDDHFSAVANLHAEAIRTAQIAWPESLRQPAEKISGETSAEDLLSSLAVSGIPIPSYAPLVDACNPAKQNLSEQLRADCLVIANLAAYKAGSLLANMIGSVIVRRLLPGSDEYQRARELRRHYVYSSAMRDRRTAEQVRASRDDLMGSEFAMFGEIEAIKRTLDRAGIPRDPPVDWQPENPELLMIPEEREAYRAGSLALGLRLQDGRE